MTGVLTIFVNDVAALSFFSFAPSFVLPSIRGMTALTRQFDHFYEGSNSQGNNKYTFHKLNGQTFQIFPMSLMCHVSFVFCWQIRYSYHGQELTQTVPKSWPPSSGCSSWARYHVLSACRLKYWYFWYTLVILSVRFYRCQMIFSFCFQGGEEQHSILLATTGDRWRQSGLDRPDSTVIFAFFHIRSFAVPREVCMIVGFHWFSTFLPGWGSFAGIWRARHVVSKCKTHVTCSLFCDR